jgi:hypothetical protein
MGVAQCFLGKAWGQQMEEQATSRSPDTNSSWVWAVGAYIRTPEFLYFHSIIIALQVLPSGSSSRKTGTGFIRLSCRR